MRVNNPSVAEDLVQETFLAGIKSLKNFGGRSTLKTWLTGILKFKVMDYYRKSSREKTFTQLNSFYEDEEKEHFREDGHWLHGDFSPADWSAEQWENVDRQEFMAQFLACSEKLPPKIRQDYIMRELDLTTFEANEDQDWSTPETIRRTVDRREARTQVEDALKDIPAKQKQALELALFSEMTHSEIARTMEQPLGTVKSWLKRGLFQLRNTLTKPAV